MAGTESFHLKHVEVPSFQDNMPLSKINNSSGQEGPRDLPVVLFISLQVVMCI